MPISRRKIFEKCPEWRTIEAHPVEHAGVDAIDHGVGDLVVGDVAPPDEDIGRGQDGVGQAVLRLVEGRGPHLDVVRSGGASAMVVWMPAG